MSKTAISRYGGRYYPSSNLRGRRVGLAFGSSNFERSLLSWIADEPRTVFQEHRVENV